MVPRSRTEPKRKVAPSFEFAENQSVDKLAETKKRDAEIKAALKEVRENKKHDKVEEKSALAHERKMQRLKENPSSRRAQKDARHVFPMHFAAKCILDCRWNIERSESRVKFVNTGSGNVAFVFQLDMKSKSMILNLQDWSRLILLRTP